MLRCLSCNGILQRTESVCYSCGEAVPGGAKDKSKGKGMGGFGSIVSLLFYLSLGMTVARIFSDHVPPFAVCLPATLILLFVKSSAIEVKKNRT
jgi:hypothetical protein